MKTLQHYNKPIFQPLAGVGDQSCKPVSARVKSIFGDNTETPLPDAEALRFYLLNHTVAIIRQNHLPTQPLGELETEVMDRYTAITIEQASRLFCYMLLICTRESRHIRNSTAFSDLGLSYSDKAHKLFLNKIKGIGSSAAADKFMEVPPSTPLAMYVESLERLFSTGKWGGGYGGKAWAEVTALLCRFVRGEISGELFVDQAYTLAHNNGPIFNKGMFYDCYTNKFVKLLDIQRSGQIPELMYSSLTQNDTLVASNAVAKVADDYAMCQGILGDHYETYVDWYKVSALGGVGHYQSEKQSQITKYGESPWKTKEEAAKAAELAAAKQEAELQHKQQMEAAAAHQAEVAKTHYKLGAVSFKKEQRA